MRNPTLAAALFCSVALGQDQGPKAPQVPINSPQGQLQLAITDLASNVRIDDAPFVRYLSFYAAGLRLDEPKVIGRLPLGRRVVFDEQKMLDFRRVFSFWINHMNASKTRLREVEIDGPRGIVQQTPVTTLVRIDIRDAVNWTRTAWILVADRDYLFREPLLPNRETTFGRLVCGIETNPETFSAGFILNAYQLFRDTLEANRTQSYYDLLYAFERHPDKDAGKVFIEVPTTPLAPTRPKPTLADAMKKRPWEGGKWPGDGKEYPAGAFEYNPDETWAKEQILPKLIAEWETEQKAAAPRPQERPLKVGDVIPKVAISVKDAGKGDKNFPAKGVDFEKRWGVDVNEADIKNFLIDPRVGGIAAGRDGDARNGSIVALHDRAIRIATSKLTPGGWGARTYDVFKNTGDKDYIERFREIALGDIKFDGGELLAILPNGSQAGVLVNDQDARVEIANTNLAQIMSPLIDSRYHDVRTMQGCVGCHMPNGGFNNFVEQYKETALKGVDLKSKDAQVIRDFYESWSGYVVSWQARYKAYTEESTRFRDQPGWTGDETWTKIKDARDRYDEPVTIEVVAFELGYETETLRQILLGEKQADNPTPVRLNQLIVGKGIPRETYQDEVAFKLFLFMDSIRGQDEPVKRLMSDQLLEEAIKKFGKVMPIK